MKTGHDRVGAGAMKTLTCLLLIAALLPACAARPEHGDGYGVSSSERGGSSSSSRSVRPRSALGVGIGLGGAGLKQATQSEGSASIVLPRDAMSRLFGVQDQFHPTPEQVKAIEGYAQSLSGPDRTRLDAELEACRKAGSACVVTPTPERPRS